MNILTSNGYCVRFLTDWAGPEAMVTKLAIRLGVPSFPDDPLRFTGSVTGKTEGTETARTSSRSPSRPPTASAITSPGPRS